MNTRIPAAIILLAFFGCSRADTLETITIEINGHPFAVEIARDPEDQRRGLKFRKDLAEDRGMLFYYESDRPLHFYMEDTLVPLSIAYISSEGVIKEIYDMKPKSLRTISSVQSVRFALELNQGTFERIGARPGTSIDFPEGFLP